MELKKVKELFENYQFRSGGGDGLSYHKMLKKYEAEYPLEYAKATMEFHTNPIQTRDELFRYSWKNRYPEKYEELKQIEMLFAKVLKALQKYMLHRYFYEGTGNDGVRGRLDSLIVAMERADDAEFVHKELCRRNFKLLLSDFAELKNREKGDYYERNAVCAELKEYEMKVLGHYKTLMQSVQKIKEFSVGDLVFFEDSHDERSFEVVKVGKKITVKSWFGTESKVFREDIYKLIP